MPYGITKKGSKFILQNKATGRVLGTHGSQKEAMSQMRAVHANDGEAKRMMGKGEMHMAGRFPMPKKKM